MFSMTDGQKKTLSVSAAVVGGVTVLGVGALLVWNSDAMRSLRAARRTGRWMHKIGVALCSLAQVIEQ
jgi:hypothetical protein